MNHYDWTLVGARCIGILGCAFSFYVFPAAFSIGILNVLHTLWGFAGGAALIFFAPLGIAWLRIKDDPDGSTEPGG